jgi:hypothetical protein
MSPLLDFYRGQGTDSEGRRLAELWAWDDEELEIVHDFIQWLFPLPEPSRANADAPLLTKEEIAAFHADAALRASLRKSFERMLHFFGLAWEGDAVVEAANFKSRVPDIWAFPNHNWLRISRILRSLSLLGLEPEARAFYRKLDELHSSRRYPIMDDTFGYWTRAVGG